MVPSRAEVRLHSQSDWPVLADDVGLVVSEVTRRLERERERKATRQAMGELDSDGKCLVFDCHYHH